MQPGLFAQTLFVLTLFAAPALAAPPAANGDLSDAPCAYPAAALTAKAQGTTMLSYTGTAKGGVENLKLVAASGSIDLDKAAAECLLRWHFDPASALGKLLIGSNRIAIAWTIPADGSPALGRRAAMPHRCQQDYPAAAVTAQASGITKVHFTITVDGRIKEPSVAVSSGHPELDAAALECVRYWRYRPALRDGQPVEVPWNAEVRWELYDPPVPEE